MKVAIDTGPLTTGHKVRGIGVHTRELLKAFVDATSKGIQIKQVDFGSEDLSKFDLVHFQNFNPYVVSLPAEKVCKKMVITIHDLIPLVFPKKYKPGVKGRLNFIKQKSRLKNFDAVITISQTSKNDIVKYLGVSPDKVHVVYLAPRNLFVSLPNLSPLLKQVKKKFNLPDKFVLYVGDVNYNKNISTLIDACEIAGLPLVIAGKQAKEIDSLSTHNLKTIKGPRDYVRFLLGRPHPELAHYKGLLEKFKTTSVIRVGFVSDEELVAIYNLATVYCQPSLYEGFGLPVLEAMKVGCPVVASKTPALVEIAKGAALFANPKEKNDLAKQLTKVCQDESIRKELSKKGIKRASNFTWSKTAKETVALYKALLQG